MNEIVVEDNIENLDSIFLKVEELLEDNRFSTRSKLQLELIIEELFVNICNYAYEDGGEIKIQYGLFECPLRIVMKFIDDGVEFNPLDMEKPDLTLDADERDIGGLGLTIVRKNVDRIDYEYKNNQNVLKIEKILF